MPFFAVPNQAGYNRFPGQSPPGRVKEHAMGEPVPSPPSLQVPEGRRLDSWKEIAAYLNRDVTTVQRWEKREGMPVHRQLHDRAGSIYAFRSELDAWVQARTLRATQERKDGENGSPLIGDTAPPQNPPLSTALPAQPAPRIPWIVWLPLAVAATLAIAAGLWVRGTEYFWRSPVADAQFQTLTDFEGFEQAAALSRDGHFAAFLSDRDGQMDVWVTQVGSGEFHNLTGGSAPELVNPSIRTLGFSPDGSLVTFWVRKQGTAAASGGDISIQAVPTLGGPSRPYLDGIAEFDWSHDASRLAYHTPGPGDPLFVSDGLQRTATPPIFVAPSGVHCHFPVWSPDNRFIYFVQGTLPDKLDIWRIAPTGGPPERLTTFNARVTHPVLLDRRTLMFLAGDPAEGGLSLYSMDVERRIPHRLSSGLDRYTSLAASADGHRLVVTLARSKRTLWRLPILQVSTSPAAPAAPVQISSSTGTMFSPRLGPNYLLYTSSTATSESILKLTNGTALQLWTGQQSQVLGGPAISPDGRSIAFSVQQRGRALLYVMQADGSNAHIVADSLELRGSPTWAPDAQSITTAVADHGVPHLVRVPLDGRTPTTLVKDYSLDPVWVPDGRFAIYSGPDIGTKFPVKGVTADGAPRPLPDLTLTRGTRHLAFLSGGRRLVFLHGEIKHKNLWLLDLDTGAQRELTSLPPDFDVRDFDISPDGQQVVLERAEERSDVAVLDLPRQ
jgi:Tol biopolymer transport system component